MTVDLGIFQTQRVFTPKEYEMLGYQLKQDILFDEASYSSYRTDINPLDIAYRADTKQEYARDLGYAFAKVAKGIATGGTSSIGGVVWRTFVSVVLD